LNYGQGIFEGIKAFRTEKNRIVVFRPEENAKRLNDGAKRFLMPELPIDIFLDGVDQVVRSNSRWVPPTDKGSLYIRPLLFGSGPGLGVNPSDEYTFAVFVSPVGNYFKRGSPISLLVTSYHRSAPHGSGDVKSIGNYAPIFLAQKEAKEGGFGEVLFLDAKYDRFVEEAGASNLFCFQKETLFTPSLDSILPGITRLSTIQLAKEMGIKVIEKKLDIEQILEAEEVFCTGTGASISSVGSITWKGKTVDCNKTLGKISQKLRDTLTNIQYERCPDQYGWLHDPYIH